MSNFKKYYSIVILSLLSTAALGDSELAPKTPDGRFGTPCYNISGLGGEVCEVPFARLLATPERYDGKTIRVTGYLINIDDSPYGSLVLFANRSSFDSGAEIEGITLRGGKMPKKIEKKINSGLGGVYVVGKFNAKYDNDDKIYRLGRMEDIIEIDTWGARIK
jgi:hypothetical protein